MLKILIDSERKFIIRLVQKTEHDNVIYCCVGLVSMLLLYYSRRLSVFVVISVFVHCLFRFSLL